MKSVEPTKPRQKPLTKVCTNCGEDRPRSEYKPKKHGYVEPYCYDCAPYVKKRYYEKSKQDGTHRNGHYIRKFGITLSDYQDMFESQEGLCAICQEPQLNKLLSVDHDHTTGQVRGLLCDKCNWSLGALRDNIKTLESAIIYLIEWRKK